MLAGGFAHAHTADAASGWSEATGTLGRLCEGSYLLFCSYSLTRAREASHIGRLSEIMAVVESTALPRMNCNEIAHVASMSDGELKQLFRTLRRAKNRRHWRRLGVARTSQVAAALRFVERAMAPSFVRREKQKGMWILFGAKADGNAVPVAEVRLNKVRRVTDFKETAVEIVLIDKALLDVGRLEQELQRHVARHQHSIKPEENP